MPQSTDYNSLAYIFDISIGNDPNRQGVLFRGLNTNMTINDAQTIWDQGGDYAYMTQNTALYISSDSALDVGIEVTVTGLNEDFVPITHTATLNGQNQVLLGNDYYRNGDAVVTGGGFLQGEVYVAETDTLTGGIPDDATKIKAKIPLGTLQGETNGRLSDHVSHNGFYTVPAGHTFLLTQIIASSSGQEGILAGRLRPDGQTYWTDRNPLPITNNRIAEVFNPPIALPEKLDLELRGTGGNGQIQSVRTQGVLVKN